MKTINIPSIIKSSCLLLALSAVISISIVSCRKDKLVSTSPLATNTQFELSKPVTVGIIGQVVLENGDPAQNANVQIGGFKTITDQQGNFEFESVSVPQKHAAISVALDGYFDGHRTLIVTENAIEFTKIRLMKKEESGSFNSKNGGAVSVKNGGKIIFESNSIMNKASKEFYDGTVHVYAKWIDPSGENLFEFMPGCLRGITTLTEEKYLQTFGMMAVEMFDDNGNALQILTSKQAEMRFPIPSVLNSEAPNDMPLWYLDESIGLWKEEGRVVKTSLEYVGKVSHFTFWNCDLANSIGFTIQLNDSLTNQPLANHPVKITKIAGVSNGSNVSMGYTNSLGIAQGNIPSNSTLKLESLFACNNNLLLEKEIIFSSGNSAINYGILPVHVISQNYATVTGTVLSCNGAPLNNGTVVINPTGLSIINAIKVITNSSGQFTVNLPICNSSLPLDITVYDAATRQHSVTQMIYVYPGSNNIGNLNACGVESEYVEIHSIDNGIVSSTIIMEPNGVFNCTYNSYSNKTTFSGFSSIIGVAQSFNIQVDGLANNTSSHTLYKQIEMINGQSTYSMTIANNIPVDVTEYGALGSFVTANYVFNFEAPYTAYHRRVVLHVKKDN